MIDGIWQLALYWRHNDHDGVSNHQPRGCLLSPFIQTQIKENIKAPRHWPLYGEFTGTGEFPAQRASYAENVSNWWRHHVLQIRKATNGYITEQSFSNININTKKPLMAAGLQFLPLEKMLVTTHTLEGYTVALWKSRAAWKYRFIGMQTRRINMILVEHGRPKWKQGLATFSKQDRIIFLCIGITSVFFYGGN